MGWSVAKHDVVPMIEVFLPYAEPHAYLWAFLHSEGSTFTPPYHEVRHQITYFLSKSVVRRRGAQLPRSDVEDQRLRTWKTLFENSGFFYVDSSTQNIELTPLGRAIKRIWVDVDKRIFGANNQIARFAISVLNRVLLRNPLDSGDYPADADLMPFRCIWKAMRLLDNKLHWEEMNRVIMHLYYEDDVQASIDKIRAIRLSVNGRYDETSLKLLGAPCVEEGAETQRRITPWFTRAGFGGLLISPENDDGGYRVLNEQIIDLIDSALRSNPLPSPDVYSSKTAYLQYLGEELREQTYSTSASDEVDINIVIQSIQRYGDSKLICLSGLPGTGKTRLARIVGMKIAEGNPYRYEEIQFHESTSYNDFIEGFVPKPSGDGFELRKKVFREINMRALADPSGNPYVLLIEEFSRANIHNVLGELLTYIEHRGRTFRYAISQDLECVAQNLVIIVTMNPRDKSAIVLDHAIVRRMHQINLSPSSIHLREILKDKITSDDLAKLEEWFDKYRNILPFGHGVFADIQTKDDLHTLWYGTLQHFMLDNMGGIKTIFKEVADNYPWK